MDSDEGVLFAYLLLLFFSYTVSSFDLVMCDLTYQRPCQQMHQLWLIYCSSVFMIVSSTHLPPRSDWLRDMLYDESTTVNPFVENVFVVQI